MYVEAQEMFLALNFFLLKQVYLPFRSEGEELKEIKVGSGGGTYFIVIDVVLSFDQFYLADLEIC